MKNRLLFLGLLILVSSSSVSCGNTSSSSIDGTTSSSSSVVTPSISSDNYSEKGVFFSSKTTGEGNGSIEEPYSSLDQLFTYQFEPGSHIYLETDSMFYGSLKLSNVHGSENEPIVITSYGKGKKPKIDGNDLVGGAVVHLENCSNIIIQNLEIYDSAQTENDRRGILVEVNNPNNNEEIITYKNIKLNNLYIHDILGFRDAENSGMGMFSKKTGGIHLWSSDGCGRTENFEISNCKISNVSNVGIATWYQMNGETVSKVSPYSKDFNKYAHIGTKIHHNEINYIGKNAIFLRHQYGGIIEYNVIHDTAIHCVSGNTIVTSYVHGTIIQYNEGYRNMAIAKETDGKLQDGCMLDADLQSRDTIWQYNYSHDNSFGLFLNCTSYNENSEIKDKVIVRYNLSVNDLGKKGIVYINYESDGIYVYNNTIVTGKETENIIQSNDKRTSYFYNNLIYNRSKNAKFAFNDASGLVAEYNLVYNEGESTIDNSDFFKTINVNGVYEDPIFQGFLQEDSDLGIENLFTYQLELNSPALNIGKEVDAEEDFFGNKYKKSIGFYCGI